MNKFFVWIKEEWQKNMKIILVFIIAGLLIGVFFDHFALSSLFQNSNWSGGQGRNGDGENCTSTGETFIRGGVCNGNSDSETDVIQNLQNKLKVSIDTYQQTGKVERMGVFVRDMNSTRFADINGNDEFFAASLLKLPLVIAGYKLAEVQPNVLDQEIKYTGSQNQYEQQNIKVKEENKLKVGQSYSLRDLMKRSIIYSDNTAAQLVSNFYQPGYFDLILQALGIQFRLKDGSNENLVTAKTYANLFRTLYNSSYVSKEYSNEILSILSEVDYKNGAVAKLPSDLKVAHKFAERTILDDKTGEVITKELHECGLVYTNKSRRPYTFCIMTQGKNFADLEEVEQDTSLQIYNTMLSNQ